MSKNSKTTSQQQAPQEEIVDENLENQVDGAGAGDESGAADATGSSETSSTDTSGESDLAAGADQDAAQLEAALAAAAAAPGPVEVTGLDTAEEQPINDAPATPEAPAQQDNPTVADAPASEPVVVRSARAPSVTLEQPLTKAEVKVQQNNITLQLIADSLRNYTELMAPNVVANATTGKGQQLNLWKTIEKVLKLEGAEFIKGYGMLLGWVAENRKGALSERYMYRYFPELALGQADRRNFDRMLNLLTATADPATRRMGLQQVDLAATVAGFRDSAIQQRVTEFYSL